jgi:hypothetical protein
MRASSCCLGGIGLALCAVALAVDRKPAEVVLPLYDAPVHFFQEGKQALLVGSLPQGVSSLSAEACASCHKKEYTEWKASAHARSITEPVFAAAFRAEPRVLCRSCHSPLLQQHPRIVRQREPSWTPAAHERAQIRRTELGQPYTLEPNPSYQGALVSEGVTCATCHVRGRTVLAAKPAVSDRAPHALSYSPALRTADFCGGCHQFQINRPQAHPFERNPARTTTVSLLQKLKAAPNRDDDPPVPPQPGLDFRYHQESREQHTLDQFRISPAAALGESCQSCHMPAEWAPSGSRRRHDWPGRSSPQMLQQAIALSARLDRPAYRQGDLLQAVIKIRNHAGHRFPTGDALHAGILDIWLTDGARSLGRQVFVMSSQNGSDPPFVSFRSSRGFAIVDGDPPGFPDSGRSAMTKSRLDAPNQADTRLLPDAETTLVFSQPVTAAMVRATNLTLRVRVFHSAVHPGFRGTSVDPGLNTMRLIRQETLPIPVEPPAGERMREAAAPPEPHRRG